MTLYGEIVKDWKARGFMRDESRFKPHSIYFEAASEYAKAICAMAGSCGDRADFAKEVAIDRLIDRPLLEHAFWTKDRK